MRLKNLNLLALPLGILGVILILVLTRPATAAPTPDNSGKAIDHIAQSSGVTLEKEISAETVPLGEVFSYTVTIRNGGAETINATLTDVIPEGLVLQTELPATIGQTHLITVTRGVAEAHNNAVSWSDSLASDEEAVITYFAIAPTTSTPGQTFDNIASLEFGGTTLEAGTTVTTEPPDLGIWGRFVNFLALILISFDSFLTRLNIPFAFGFAIILFTVLVRLATFPLNMQQIKSSKAMQELQPKMKELQEKYKNDREKLAQAQMSLYKEHGVNPLGGCLPMLVQMPIWFALYRSLLQLSREGLLGEGFFWIPSLAGPVSNYGVGISWLWPFPPSIGWVAAVSYLILPVLLVVSQVYMQQMMTPPSTDPQQASMQSVMKFMPLMFGYFALIVPSGLTLYWFTSNILAMAQQYFTQTQLQPGSATSGTSVASTNPAPANSAVGNSGSSSSASANSEESDKTSKKNARSKRRKKSRRKR